MPQPFHYGQNASHHAQKDEDNHCPLKRIGFRDSEYGGSEFNSQRSQDKKPDPAAGRHNTE